MLLKDLEDAEGQNLKQYGAHVEILSQFSGTRVNIPIRYVVEHEKNLGTENKFHLAETIRTSRNLKLYIIYFIAVNAYVISFSNHLLSLYYTLLIEF